MVRRQLPNDFARTLPGTARSARLTGSQSYAAACLYWHQSEAILFYVGSALSTALEMTGHLGCLRSPAPALHILAEHYYLGTLSSRETCALCFAQDGTSLTQRCGQTCVWSLKLCAPSGGRSTRRSRCKPGRYDMFRAVFVFGPGSGSVCDGDTPTFRRPLPARMTSGSGLPSKNHGCVLRVVSSAGSA